ncbi:calcium-binding protein [Hydrogenophaga sp.]|uniref:calcium-binding protein n=1 Tax=Hydrogenophaga sp. TaxID=1904254 RepID=UPI002616C297|nr:calcium-binding protein [Hydrogenophaga sp.]MCW5655261.1 calcium-binding protein [Hydrogenophaga sp.]
MAHPAVSVVNRQGGQFKLAIGREDVGKVSVSDIDLVFVLKNGERVVLLGGALDAMSGQPPEIVFADGSVVSANLLLRQVPEFSASVSTPDSPLTTPQSSQSPQESPGEQGATTPQVDPAAAPTDADAATAQLPVASQQDVVAQSLQAVEKQVSRAEAISPPSIAETAQPAQISAPPERPGSIPVAIGFMGGSEFRSLALTNVTGQRQEGAALYGAGGDAISATDASARVQAAAEHLQGTAGNDVLYGDDPTRLGAGFAKMMTLTVGNSKSVNSYTITGMPDDFSFEGGTRDASGVWHMEVPATVTTENFEGTYAITNKLLYPTTLAMDESGLAQSFILSIDLVVTGYKGDSIHYTRTVTVMVKDVNTANDLLINSPDTHFTLVLPARGLSNVIEGGDGNDTLYGAMAHDTLDGGAGADVMAGGAGNDTYVVDDIGDTVIERVGEGTDLVLSSVSFSLSDNVENLTLTGAASGLHAVGNAQANVLRANDAGSRLEGGAENDSLYGGAGADTLDGGTGEDLMVGGRGDDVYVVDDPGDVVLELPGEGTDTVMTGLSYTLTQDSNVENLILTGSNNVNGTGNDDINVLIGNDGANLLSGGAGVDTLSGGGGNDTLDGGTGADAMAGGSGDDTYVVDNVGDTVTESAGEGTDLVLASVSHALSANVENLTLTGSTAGLTATGNGLANVLIANNAGSLLAGADGNDTGTIYVFNAGDGADSITDADATTGSQGRFQRQRGDHRQRRRNRGLCCRRCELDVRGPDGQAGAERHDWQRHHGWPERLTTTPCAWVRALRSPRPRSAVRATTWCSSGPATPPTQSRSRVCSTAARW